MATQITIPELKLVQEKNKIKKLKGFDLLLYKLKTNTYKKKNIEGEIQVNLGEGDFGVPAFSRSYYEALKQLCEALTLNNTVQTLAIDGNFYKIINQELVLLLINAVKACKSLTKIIFQDYEGNAYISAFFSEIFGKNSSNVKVLQVDSNPFTNKQLDSLFQALQFNSRLTHFHLGRGYIDSGHELGKSIAKMLMDNKALESVSFGSFKFGPADGKLIALALANNRNLRSVTFNNSGFDSEFAHTLALEKDKFTLEILNLSGCSFDKADGKSILEYIQRNTAIRKFSFENCGLSQTVMHQIGNLQQVIDYRELIKQTKNNANKDKTFNLNICHNLFGHNPYGERVVKNIFDAVFRAFMIAFKGNTILESINLGYTPLTKTHVGLLADCLTQNYTIKQLTIATESHNTEVNRLLETVLSPLSAIEKLDIRCVNGSNATSPNIAHLLNNNKLKELSLANIPLRDCAFTVATNLKNNTLLKELCLEDCNLDSYVGAAFADALKNNRDLAWFKLCDKSFDGFVSLNMANALKVNTTLEYFEYWGDINDNVELACQEMITINTSIIRFFLSYYPVDPDLPGKQFSRKTQDEIEMWIEKNRITKNLVDSISVDKFESSELDLSMHNLPNEDLKIKVCNALAHNTTIRKLTFPYTSPNTVLALCNALKWNQGIEQIYFLNKDIADKINMDQVDMRRVAEKGNLGDKDGIALIDVLAVNTTLQYINSRAVNTFSDPIKRQIEEALHKNRTKENFRRAWIVQLSKAGFMKQERYSKNVTKMLFSFAGILDGVQQQENPDPYFSTKLSLGSK